MQAKLRAALQQKTRLAALGTAVTKINHDLRNILTTARLVADRLAGSDDPEVKRMTPTLLAAIDRAVELCTKTLDFTREGPPALNRQRFPLRQPDRRGRRRPAGAGERPAGLRSTTSPASSRSRPTATSSSASSPTSARTPLQAGATRRRRQRAPRATAASSIEVADNGPGLPPRARDNLFQPFAGSARPGGSRPRPRHRARPDARPWRRHPPRPLRRRRHGVRTGAAGGGLERGRESPDVRRAATQLSVDALSPAKFTTRHE